jgi:hypothetical protein
LWAGREIGPAPERIAPTAKDGQGSYDHWSKKNGLFSKTENDGLGAQGSPQGIRQIPTRAGPNQRRRRQVAAANCRPL